MTVTDHCLYGLMPSFPVSGQIKNRKTHHDKKTKGNGKDYKIINNYILHREEQKGYIKSNNFSDQHVHLQCKVLLGILKGGLV